MCVHMFMRVCVCLCVCLCVCMCLCVYVFVCVCLCVCMWWLCGVVVVSWAQGPEVPEFKPNSGNFSI